MSKSPTIILASASKQRRELMKLINHPFKVIPSGAKEIEHVTTSCADLVRKNALIKARHVANQVDTGLVIGSDTVVFLGKKSILGKPKDLAEAKRTLKRLMAKPCWIYSGIAVIDSKTGKENVDYERTKVYMTKLTDQEIDRYHSIVPPLDKAGGFDIEGFGSLFIRRIEGCYTNVIGLPMAKLAGMLKTFGISVLSLLCMITFSGCASEFNLATQRQETYIYDTDKEVSVGSGVARGLEKKFDMVEDLDVNERVQTILDRIVQNSDRKDIVYFIKVIDDDMVNAVSLPGGYVYIFKGLYDKIKTDDQLAGIIAHEVAHITAKHGVKRIQNSYGAFAVQILAGATDGQLAGGVNVALASLFSEYAQRDEFQADKLGVEYMARAGYDPRGMIEVLNILQKEQVRSGLRTFSYWKTHPNLSARRAAANKEINGSLAFRDYLNLLEYYE